MKPTFLLRKFIRSASGFAFLSKDHWLTDLHLAVVLPSGTEVEVDKLEDSCWCRGRKLEYLSPYFESVLSHFSPLVGLSKSFLLTEPERVCLRKCQAEDGRLIAVDAFYLRVVRNLWPKAEFSIAEYGEVEGFPNLIARNEAGALIGLLMSRSLTLELPSVIRKWNSLPVHPIKK
jgi:hypothetical protein